MHTLHLDNKFFNLIKSGSKRIEMRLNDEKRRDIKENDQITFVNRDTNEELVVTVVKITKYPNFEELYKNYDKELLGYAKDDEASASDMELYYSLEEQRIYGVLAIEVSLIDTL